MIQWTFLKLPIYPSNICSDFLSEVWQRSAAVSPTSPFPVSSPFPDPASSSLQGARPAHQGRNSCREGCAGGKEIAKTHCWFQYKASVPRAQAGAGSRRSESLSLPPPSGQCHCSSLSCLGGRPPLAWSQFSCPDTNHGRPGPGSPPEWHTTPKRSPASCITCVLFPSPNALLSGLCWPRGAAPQVSQLPGVTVHPEHPFICTSATEPTLHSSTSSHMGPVHLGSHPRARCQTS